MRHHRKGLTVIEVLIALAVIAVAFAALAYVQVTNLHATARSRLTTEAKTVAANVLQARIDQILQVEKSGDSRYNDASTGYESYYFVDYYWSCLSSQTIQNPSGTRTALRSVTCSDTGAEEAVQDGMVTPKWTIIGESGVGGEGVIDITVTATHSAGPAVTLSDRLSCYDVYPSPTIDTPAPCPVPTQTGGGRTP